MKRARVLRYGKVALSVVGIAFVVARVPFADGPAGPGLVTILGRARVSLVLLAALAYASGVVFWAARWRALLGLGGVKLPLPLTTRFILEAQAAGVVLPGGVAGDALRVTSVVERGADSMRTIASVLLDRILGLATLTGLAAALALLQGDVRFDATVFVLVSCTTFAFVVVLLGRFAAKRGLRFDGRPRLARLLSPLLSYLGAKDAWPVLLRATMASVGVSFMQLLSVRVALSALGAEPSSEASVQVGTALSFVVAAVPALPGGWGTSDASFVFLMGRASVSASHALGAWLLYRMLWYAAAFAGGALALQRPNIDSSRRMDHDA